MLGGGELKLKLTAIGYQLFLPGRRSFGSRNLFLTGGAVGILSCREHRTG
jgi:hypothetical protein